MARPRTPAHLPIDRTRIPPGPPPSVALLPDAAAAFRATVTQPVGMPALEKLVRPGAKVTIGIQDGRATHYHPDDQDLRILGLPILLDLLDQYGVRPEDIQIKVANALHRMWTRKEMTHILGPRLPYTLGGRLACIDATDPNQFVNLGMNRRGMEVMVHRSVVESDLFIFMSVPGGFFQGGWKSILVGMSNWESIRYHHRPWPFASGHSVQDPKNSSFHKLLNEMGTLVEAELARRGHPPVMKIEGVLTTSTPQQFAAIDAGLITPVREMHIDMLLSQLVTDVEGQTDVLLMGMADGDGYSRLSVFNPIHCRNKALSGLFNAYHENPLVRKRRYPHRRQSLRPQVQSAQPPLVSHALPRGCYRPSKTRWRCGIPTPKSKLTARSLSTSIATALRFTGRTRVFCTDRGLYALKHLGGVLAAGVPKENEAVARRMGFEPFPTIDAALSEAEARLGKDCTITYHQHLEENGYFKRVHVNGNTA